MSGRPRTSGLRIGQWAVVLGFRRPTSQRRGAERGSDRRIAVGVRSVVATALRRRANEARCRTPRQSEAATSLGRAIRCSHGAVPPCQRLRSRTLRQTEGATSPTSQRESKQSHLDTAKPQEFYTVSRVLGLAAHNPTSARSSHDCGANDRRSLPASAACEFEGAAIACLSPYAAIGSNVVMQCH